MGPQHRDFGGLTDQPRCVPVRWVYPRGSSHANLTFCNQLQVHFFLSHRCGPPFPPISTPGNNTMRYNPSWPHRGLVFSGCVAVADQTQILLIRKIHLGHDSSHSANPSILQPSTAVLTQWNVHHRDSGSPAII